MLLDILIIFQEKWKEEEYGLCDCPSEVSDEFPHPCKHEPDYYGNWYDEVNNRYNELLKMIGNN